MPPGALGSGEPTCQGARPRHRARVPAGRLRRRRAADQPGRGRRRDRRDPAHVGGFEGYYKNEEATQEPLPRAAGTGRAISPTGTPTAGSTSRAAPMNGSGSTARTSPPPRSRPSSPAIPASGPSPSTRCPTTRSATGSWRRSSCRDRRRVRPGGLRRLSSTASPISDEVAPGLRPGRRRAPQAGQHEDRQAAAAPGGVAGRNVFWRPRRATGCAHSTTTTGSGSIRSSAERRCRLGQRRHGARVDDRCSDGLRCVDRQGDRQRALAARPDPYRRPVDPGDVPGGSTAVPGRGTPATATRFRNQFRLCSSRGPAHLRLRQPLLPSEDALIRHQRPRRSRRPLGRRRRETPGYYISGRSTPTSPTRRSTRFPVRVRCTSGTTATPVIRRSPRPSETSSRYARSTATAGPARDGRRGWRARSLPNVGSRSGGGALRRPRPRAPRSFTGSIAGSRRTGATASTDDHGGALHSVPRRRGRRGAPRRARPRCRRRERSQRTGSGAQAGTDRPSIRSTTGSGDSPRRPAWS